MKKILFFFIVYTVSAINLLWAQQLNLSATTTQVDINTTFGVTVQILNIQNPSEVKIDGMSQFSVRGQSTSSSMQIANGQTSAQYTLQLQVQPMTT